MGCALEPNLAVTEPGRRLAGQRAQFRSGAQTPPARDAISRCQAARRMRPIRIRALVRPTQIPVTPQP